MTDDQLLDCFLEELRELMVKYGASVYADDLRVMFEILPLEELQCVPT